MDKIQPVISVIWIKESPNKEKKLETKSKKKEDKEFSEMLSKEMSKYDLRV